MSLRHLARQIVVQSLFTWDFYKQDSARQEEFFQWNVERHEGTIVDLEFPKSCYQGVIKKVDVIDAIIAKAAPQWPIERIAPVDRNILRLGIYELLFAPAGQVPPRVAINEAIELGKTLGGNNTYKFISGVLGSIYEVSDLKKDDKPHKDSSQQAEMPVVSKVGSVVYSMDSAGVLRLAMVHDIFGTWTLSKGGMLDTESQEQACARVIKKEIGLDITVADKLSTIEYIARHPEQGKMKKQVTFFLGLAPYTEMELEQENDGLVDARWVTIDEMEDLSVYPDIKKIIAQALALIQ